MPQNQDVYRVPKVAADYARQSKLYPPEQAILRLIMSDLETARMLDLGVGGGRTTLHFARVVREYVGADYSESMILECRKRFAAHPDRLTFVVCDARSMQMFPSGCFDFILFSFNGIDYVNHPDRLTILKEIQRIGRPGAWFCFSSHNLNSCAQLFEWHRMISLKPKFVARTAKRLVLRFVYNWHINAATVKRSQYLMFNDGAHSGRLLTYYIRPEEQVIQLSQGFTEVRVFSSVSGAEIVGQSELQRVEDAWLYYLCKVKC